MNTAGSTDIPPAPPAECANNTEGADGAGAPNGCISPACGAASEYAAAPAGDDARDGIDAALFTGENLAVRRVRIRVSACRSRLVVAGIEPPIDIAPGEVRISDRLANVPRFLSLPDGRTLETHDNDAIDALLATRRIGRLPALIHWLEARAAVAAAASVLLIVTLFAGVNYGLPVLARHAAGAVPRQVEQELSQTTLATFLNIGGGHSQLILRERARVARVFDSFIKAQGALVTKPRVEYCLFGGYANAFALPDGTIVLTDALVRLATDDELAGIFGHELGHAELHHATQGLLRSSVVLLVVGTITGDLSTLTKISGQIPMMLITRGYSREFEAEADDYAIAAMGKAGVSPRHLASILEKIEKSRPGEGKDYTYLSTHPATKDRVKKFMDAAGAPEGRPEAP